MRLNAGDNIVVAGPRATDGLSCCVWTSYFHPEYGSRTILQAIQDRAVGTGVNVYSGSGPSPKLAIVAVGEPSYTHGTSWVKEQPYLPADQLAIIQGFKNQGIPVVVLLTMARPYVITEWNGLANALVVHYRGGEEVGPALASLLFGDYTPRGKLPWQLPRTLSTDCRENRRLAGLTICSATYRPAETCAVPLPLIGISRRHQDLRRSCRRTTFELR